MKKKSYREIAKICNVSPATVSRIANGIGSFSDETKQLVVSHLIKEGYKLKDNYDQPLNKIAIIITDLANELFCNISKNISDILTEDGYITSLCIENIDQTDLSKKLINDGAKGIIYIGNSRYSSSFECPVPAICISSSNKASFFGKKYSVMSDDFVGGQLAAQELLKKSCRNPLILNNRYITIKDNFRLQGFLYEFKKNGINIDSNAIYNGDLGKSAFNSAKDVVSYLWTKGNDFDSVYGCSDWRAYGAITALKNMNIRIPEEIKVIGYDGSRLSKYCETPFSTIRQNPDIIAAQTVQMILTLIKGEEVKQNDILVPVQLQLGQTT